MGFFFSISQDFSFSFSAAKANMSINKEWISKNFLWLKGNLKLYSLIPSEHSSLADVCVIPGGKCCVSKGQSINQHKSPSFSLTYRIRLHVDSMSSSPLSVKSLNSALIAGTGSKVLCKHHFSCTSEGWWCKKQILDGPTVKYWQKRSCCPHRCLWGSLFVLGWVLVGSSNSLPHSPMWFLLLWCMARARWQFQQVLQVHTRVLLLKEQSDVISFARKVSVVKRHLICSGCRQQPWMCWVGQVMTSTRRGTDFVFQTVQLPRTWESFGEGFKQHILAPKHQHHFWRGRKKKSINWISCMLMELDRAWELSTDFRTRSRAGQHSALSMGQTWLVPGGTGLPQWQHGTEKWWVCSRIQKHTWKKYSPGQSFSATQFPALPSQGKENANSAAQDLVASDPSSRHIHPSTFSHFLSSINSYFTGFALPTSLLFIFFYISHLLTPLLLSCAFLKSMTAIHIPFHRTSAVVCSLDIFSDARLKAALKP